MDTTTLHWASRATHTKFAALICAIPAFSTFLALATRRRA